jgi:formate-dependent phosphoribosylglycinamide formyltransferase (GAR transformylase)
LIASRLAQVDASIAFVLNGHVGAVESQAVREKLDLEDKRERIIAAAEATTTLTNRQRDSKLRKLAAEMEQLRKQHNALRKEQAMEQLEAEFAGDAA